MFKPKIGIAIIVILLLINTAVLCLLWMQKKGRLPQQTNAKEYLIKELNLSAEQTKQFEELRNEHFNSIQRLSEQTRNLKDKFFDNISISAIDSTTIKTITRNIAENEAEKDRLTLYHFRKLRSILNPQQQEKFDQIIKDVLRMMALPPGLPPPGDQHGSPDNNPPPG